MLKPQRSNFATPTSLVGGRDSGYGALGPAVAPRTPVLPTRPASAQLELPLLWPTAAPRQRLRTG